MERVWKRKKTVVFNIPHLLMWNSKSKISPQSIVHRPQKKFKSSFVRPWSVDRGPLTGFTLVEVSLTCFMASLIALVVYSTLSNGIKAWQKVNVKIAQEDTALFFDKFSDELMNSFEYPFINFQGNQNTLSFATIISDNQQYSQAGGKGIGKCEYSFDESSKELYRAQLTLSDSFQERRPDFYPILRNVTNLFFSYCFFDQEKKEYLWSQQWPPEEGAPSSTVFPLAVKLQMMLNEENKEQGIERTIFLSLAGQ